MTSRVRQRGDSVTPHPPRANLIEVAIRSEDTSIMVAPMLQVISQLPPLQRLYLHTRQPRQHIAPDPTVVQSNFPHVHNVSRPPAWVAWTEANFPTCNPNNQAPLITAVTINQHM